MKIYMFGNFGNLREVPKSGGQSSARRVKEELEKDGFKTKVIVRHRGEREGIINHWIEVLQYAIIDLYKVIKALWKGDRSSSVFLQLTYGGPMTPYELILTRTAKSMGYKCIMYLKGGQVLDYNKKVTYLHRYMFKKTMDLQSMIFFEGMESLEMARKVSDSPMIYYPNFVTEDKIPEKLTKRPDDRINLIYFGRIAPGKNVAVIIKTFGILADKYKNIYLTIIGGPGQKLDYVETIDQMINDSLYKEKITRMGLIPFSEILKRLPSQHFYIFPTQEKAEGHSNSLNEAMSQGVVPIVSNYHFNASVVGNKKLVVNGYDPQDYADKILSIIENKSWNELSKEVWNRVREKYSYQKVNDKVVKELKT